MSEQESKPLVSAETPEPAGHEPENPVNAPRPSRLRRFFLRHLPLSVAGVVILLAVTLVGLYFAACSAAFENFVRRRWPSPVRAPSGGGQNRRLSLASAQSGG